MHRESVPRLQSALTSPASQDWTFPAPHAPKYTVMYSSHLSLKPASVSPDSWSLTLVGRLVSVQVGPLFERTASQAHILQGDLRGPSRKRRPGLFKCLFLNL